MRIKYSANADKLDKDESLCALVMSFDNDRVWLFERNSNKYPEYIGFYYDNGIYSNTFTFLHAQLVQCFSNPDLTCYAISKQNFDIIIKSLDKSNDFQHWKQRLNDILEHD